MQPKVDRAAPPKPKKVPVSGEGGQDTATMIWISGEEAI